MRLGIPFITTVAAASAAVKAIEATRDGEDETGALQSHHAELTARTAR